MAKIMWVVLALLVAAFLFFGGFTLIGFDRPEQPQTVVTEPSTPPGTVAWMEPEFEFTHHEPIPPANGGDGKGGWDMTAERHVLQPPSAYVEHTQVVWEETLNDGYSWNLQGHYEVTLSYQLSHAECSSPYELATCHAGQGVFHWESGLIKFDGNQGASGKLIIRVPPIFFKESGNYRQDVSVTLTFKDDSSSYTETSSAGDGFNFNVA